MFIDTHCHLDAAEFDNDRDTVVASAQQAGVSTFIIPAVERANFGAVASVCRAAPACRAAYGIHPLFVSRARDQDLAALRAMLHENPAVAVGEIGLDHFVEPRDERLQEHYFIEQLKIAQVFNLPVLLHVRHAVDAVLKQLRRHPVRGGIAHAYNGSRQQADEFIKLGFKLGFGGAMTFPRALRIRELASHLPQEAIVLETDAPDISPVWRYGQQTGQRNAPDELPRIAAVLAELRQCSVEEVARFTTANAESVLSI
ncbi:MAG: TatD family hydrolase [Sterolibacterium sp.]|jgi:TatD DNase family protein|nr:TatD family hydrolase [Sterolibacterium sp.]